MTEEETERKTPMIPGSTMAKPGEVASYVTIDGIKNYVVGAPKPEPRLKQAMDFKRYAAEERRHLGYGYEDDHEHLELAKAFEARAAALIEADQAAPNRGRRSHANSRRRRQCGRWQTPSGTPTKRQSKRHWHVPTCSTTEAAAVVALGLDLANSIRRKTP
ncbi:MAG: hypothetical protein U1F35_05545 [Steroidobacteraceae bacterium]